MEFKAEDGICAKGCRSAGSIRAGSRRRTVSRDKMGARSIRKLFKFQVRVEMG